LNFRDVDGFEGRHSWEKNTRWDRSKRLNEFETLSAWEQLFFKELKTER